MGCRDELRRAEIFIGEESAWRSTRRELAKLINEWSSITDVKTWAGAKKALTDIAWPQVFPNEDIAEHLWNSAMKITDRFDTEDM